LLTAIGVFGALERERMRTNPRERERQRERERGGEIQMYI
jgi:hypothetical protein